MRTILDDLKGERRNIRRRLKRVSLRESERSELEYELICINISIGNIEYNNKKEELENEQV